MLATSDWQGSKIPTLNMENAMTLPSKLLWSEGLAIGPQQFQQLDRYHEARLQRLASLINPHLWGVHGVSWNADALANNSLRADTMSLVFQDGELFDAPLGDVLPSAVDLSKLPSSEHGFTFYAALPALQAHGGNVSSAGARYVQADIETPDLYSEAVSIDVAYLKKRVYLLSQLDPLNDYLAIPVIRLYRAGNGSFEIDTSFIPPGLSISAEPALQKMLDSLIDRMGAKIEALYSRHRQPGNNAVEFHGGDVSSFWMLHTLSTASAMLSHCASYRRHHPVYLFEKLMALAGGLMTFSKKYTLSDLPAYAHEDAAPGFGKLDGIIRDLIDTVLLSRYFPIALSNDVQQNTHYHGVLDATRIDRQTELCLAVNADMPALELVATVPLQFKISSPDNIELLLGRALPGAELRHMAQVPAEVPVRPNTYYFYIDSKGSIYDSMIKAQAIAIYVPAGIKGLKLELFGISGTAA